MTLRGIFASRLARIVAFFLSSAARVLRNAARFRSVGLVLWRVPISGPFPDIADHVVEAVAVWRKCRHRRGAVKAVVAAVFVRKVALPGVSHVLAAGREFVAPGELGTVETATRGEFPFGFGRQLLASPSCVGECIAKRHMHHRMIVERVDVALRPVGMPPVGALRVGPPRAKIFQIDRMAAVA